MSSSNPAPAYLRLGRKTALAERAKRARAHLSACDLCPRNCGADRTREAGTCRTGRAARMLAYIPNFHEEATSSDRAARARFSSPAANCANPARRLTNSARWPSAMKAQSAR